MYLPDIDGFRKIFGEMTVTERQYSQFEKYARLLTEWNEKINLTAITDPNGIAVKHFFDSVYPFTLTELPQGSSVADIGAGAGFPSLPLKLCRSDLTVTMIDSLGKRINFLETLLSELDVEAKCIHGRAEELCKSGQPLRGSFDIATARAVAQLSTLCELCLPYVKVGGKFIALKGKSGAEEAEQAAAAVKLLGGEIETVKNYLLPDGSERTLIVIAKTAPTPDRFPRNAAQMKKKQLK